MATFQIATPGGFEVEVRAATEEEALQIAREKWQTMPRIVARIGEGGRLFERPNGNRYFVSPGYSTTDPAAIEKIMAEGDPGKVSRDRIDQSILDQHPYASRATAFTRGTIGGGSRIDELLGKLLGSDAEAGTRALSAAQERQRPGESLGLNLAGGITSAAGLAAAAPAKATAAATKFLAGPTGMRTVPAVLRGLATGAGLGAAEGAIYGSGEGTDPESRLAEAARGAKYGAAGGAAVGAVSPLVAKGADNLLNYVKRTDVAQIASFLGISKNAAKVIRNTFDQGGDITAATAALQKAGDEAMLADAGHAAQALLDAAKASGGNAGQIVTDAVEGRATRTNARLDGVLDEALGKYDPEVGPRRTVEEIAERTRPARNEAYGKAYAQSIDWDDVTGQELQGVLERVDPSTLQEAVTTANKLMRDVDPTVPPIKLTVGEGGRVAFDSPPGVMQLDLLKQGLQASAEAARGEFGKATPLSQLYSGQARDLRTSMSRIPGYDDAVRIGGDKLAEERAYTLGRNLLKTNTEIEDVLLELGPEASQSALEAGRKGLRSYLGKLLGDVRTVASDPNRDAREVLELLKQTTTPNAKTKIAKLLPPDEALKLLKELDAAEQSVTVRTAVARNSATASRQAEMQSVEEITAPGMAGNLMAGEPINTTKALVQAVTGQTKEFSETQRQKIYQDVARALTEKKGESARTALQYLNQAIAGQPLTAAQNAFLARELDAVLKLGAGSGAARGLGIEDRRLQQ